MIIASNELLRCYIWTLNNWPWLFILPGWWRYSSLMLMRPWNEARTKNLLVIFLHGWLCRTEPTSSVTMLVDKYRQSRFLGILLQLRNLGRQGWRNSWCFYGLNFIGWPKLNLSNFQLKANPLIYNESIPYLQKK